MTDFGYARPEGDTTTAARENDPLGRFPGVLECVHCGLCLDACPTYRTTGDETESPRGRIALIRAVAEGRLAAEAAQPPLDHCVLCRACEPVCPSEVPYHQVLESHRDGSTPPAVMRLLATLQSPAKLRRFGFLLRFLRRCGLLGLAERFGPARWRALAGAVPTDVSRFRPAGHEVFNARDKRRGQVGLHLGCVNGEFYGGVLRDTVQVLTAEGYDVVVPEQPTCCGALAAHSGAATDGRTAATSTLASFPADLDAILSPAAGCAAHLHEHDPPAGVQDPLVFLHERGGLRSPGLLSARIAYDAPCHLQNVLRRADAVGNLLAEIPGLTLVSHAEADLCCGAGGIAFASDPQANDAMLDRKVGHLQAANVSAVTSGNPGCLMRLSHGLRRAHSGVEAVHPIQIVARALRNGATD